MGATLIIAVIIGLIPAAIAKSKGKNFFTWWLYGAALFIVALPHSIIMKRDQDAIEAQKMREGMQKCPHCAEMIKNDARVCRYCGRDIPAKREDDNAYL
jgi:ribosomal protein L32